MLTIRFADPSTAGAPLEATVLAIPVTCAGVAGDAPPAGAEVAEPDGEPGTPVRPLVEVAGLAAEVAAFLADSEHPGTAGTVRTLPRPLGTPRRVLLVGVGDGDESGWRSAGAAVVRAAAKDPGITLLLPADFSAIQTRGVAEGALLADYRFRLGEPKPDSSQLTELLLAGTFSAVLDEALRTAQVVAEATRLARDLTNTPSEQKSPGWFADQVTAAVDGSGVSVTVWTPERLAAEGFNGILAVGGGSARGPRLVRLDWSPEGATRHVVLVGKGITFDSGGISIKPVDGMKLMRKDMGGAAAVTATALAAARLGLRVRITALAPLAENSVSGSAWRPGDVVRHRGGRTSEILNTDAEGRVVLADALAYGAELDPDHLVDLATLTGAQSVALGKRTAALYSEDDELATALAGAAGAAGERVWRLPLIDDYLENIRSEVADVANSGERGAGSITAALFLREFTGTARARWAHLDMSAPAWVDSNDGELSRGATGWGVRTLVRWLEQLAAG